MEKFIENLNKAGAIIHTADHLIYMTYPMVKDKKLLLKILDELKRAVSLCISSILQYEYLFKRIQLYQNPSSNFNTFKTKCAKRYEISDEEIKKITELFNLADRHKQSPFEFLKNDTVVILSDSMEKITLSIEKLKEFLGVSKEVFKKAENKFLRKV